MQLSLGLHRAICPLPSARQLHARQAGSRPGGDLLSLASPRESRQREGEPDSSPGCAGTLRCSARAGCAQTRFAQTCAPLIRPVLRYSPPHNGGGKPNTKSTRTRLGASLLTSIVCILDLNSEHRVPGCQLRVPTVGFWLSDFGCWTSAVGLRLLGPGCWAPGLAVLAALSSAGAGGSGARMFEPKASLRAPHLTRAAQGTPQGR